MHGWVGVMGILEPASDSSPEVTSTFTVHWHLSVGVRDKVQNCGETKPFIPDISDFRCSKGRS